MMRALTLIQPWATAIARWGKDVENRSWAPPTSLLGQRFAVHAGRSMEADAFRLFLASSGIDLPEPLRRFGVDPLPLGAVVGTARLAGVIHVVGHTGPLKVPTVDLVAIDRDPDDMRLIDGAWKSPWLTGDFGWVLADVHELPEPVPCRGFMRLWSLAADVEKRVREQERDPRAEDRAEEGGMR